MSFYFDSSKNWVSLCLTQCQLDVCNSCFFSWNQYWVLQMWDLFLDISLNVDRVSVAQTCRYTKVPLHVCMPEWLHRAAALKSFGLNCWVHQCIESRCLITSYSGVFLRWQLGICCLLVKYYRKSPHSKKRAVSMSLGILMQWFENFLTKKWMYPI